MKIAFSTIYSLLLIPSLSIAEPCPTRGQIVVGETGLDKNAFFIQRALSYLGNWPEDLRLDGSLGPITRKIISAFQQKHDLPQTGMFDVATQRQVAQILAKETPFPILVEKKTVSFYEPNFSASTSYDDGKCIIHLDFEAIELDQDFTFETPFECRLLEIDGDAYYWQNLDTTAVAVQLKRREIWHGMINAEFIVVRPDGETAHHSNATEGRREKEFFVYTTNPRNWETKTALSDVAASLAALTKPPLEGKWQFRRWGENECLYPSAL